MSDKQIGVLLVCLPDLAVVQRNDQGLGGTRLRDLQQAHARDRAGQVDGVVLLALEVKAVDHVVHAPVLHYIRLQHITLHCSTL